MDTLIDHAAATPGRGSAFAELSMVSLGADVEQEGVCMPAGSRGAVVFVHDDAAAYEVEFVESLTAVLTLRTDQLTR